MKGRYFQLYNLVDWMVYLLAIGFVGIIGFDIPIGYEFGWVGCKGPKVSGLELKSLRSITKTSFPVLAVAGGIISADGQLAQLAHLLPACSLLRNIHPHVSCRKALIRFW